MKIMITEATLDDAPELLALHRSILEEDRFFITSIDEFHNSKERQCMITRQLIKQDNSCQFLARADRRLIGMVLIRGGFLRRMKHVGKLEIFLSADCRGQGVGRVMMEAALGWAGAHATLSKIGLTVFEDNTRAVSLYRDLGFEVEGRRVGEYCDTDGTLRNDLMMWIATPGQA